jgi:hypothetical protein
MNLTAKETQRPSGIKRIFLEIHHQHIMLINRAITHSAYLLRVFARNNLALFIFSIFALFALIFVHIRLYEYSHDDAYIHFRIATHLVEHGQPYFNIGETIKSSSSSAWTVFLGIQYFTLTLIGRESYLPVWVALINAFSTWLGAIVYVVVLSKILGKKIPVVYVIGFFIMYIAILLDSSIGLMETPVALLVVGIAFLLFIINNPLNSTLFGLAVFFRPELVIPLALSQFTTLLTNRSNLIRSFLFFSLGFIPILIYDLVFFRTIVPNTIYAKSKLYELTTTQSAVMIFPDFVPLLGSSSSFIYLSLISLFTSFFILVCLVFISIIKKMRLSGSPFIDNNLIFIIIFFLWCLILTSAYIFSNTFIFAWYAPLYRVPFILAITYFCLTRITKPINNTLIFTTIIFTLIHLNQFPGVIIGAVSNPSVYHGFETGARVKQYIALGNELYEKYPNARILTSEIGGLGYGFKGYIYDAAGLISPSAIQYHPMSIPDERSSGLIGSIPVPFVKDTKPEIIATLDVFVESLLRSEIIDDYTIIEFPIFLEEDLSLSRNPSLWGSDSLLIFLRNDIPNYLYKDN